MNTPAPSRVIAVELTTPDRIDTLMISKMYGIKGWGAFAAQIKVIPPPSSIRGSGDQVAPFYNHPGKVHTLGWVSLPQL